jgi:fructoselysine-6-P-deglycase FrlB-like protein
MIFKNIFAKKLGEKLAFLSQNKAKLSKILIITLVFEKNANFCRRLSKIAENCDHNIDLRWVCEKNRPNCSPNHILLNLIS